MIGTQIKPNHSEAVAKFVAGGNRIKEATNNLENIRAYTAEAPCKKCGTYLRSMKKNNCLECARRYSKSRYTAKRSMSTKRLETIGHYLLDKGEAVEFTSGGKKYVLKVEVAA